MGFNWGKFMNEAQKKIIEKNIDKKMNSHNFKYKDFLALKKAIFEQNCKLQEKKITEIYLQHKWQHKPEHREIDQNKSELICNTSYLGGIATGLIATQHFTDDPETILLGGFAGVAIGGLAALLNIKTFQDRPISNLMKKVIIKHKERKIKKLANKEEINNYKIHYLTKQMNFGEDYLEDFERSI